MGADSKIEWTDATVNFWWGCTKVSPGCDHCYAETLSRRFDGTGADGQSSIWGTGAPRRKIKSASSLVRKLDREAAFRGKRPWVFAQSMSDLFDVDVPIDWFAEAWAAIQEATDLRWQIVTKRVSVIEKRLEAIGDTEWPRLGGLLISVVNQSEVDRDVPRLLALKAKLNIPWVGLSCEPLLGPLNLMDEMSRPCASCDDPRVCCLSIRGEKNGARCCVDCEHDMGLDWVICGGESGPGARPMHPDWARGLRDQCVAAGVPFFFKQWGNHDADGANVGKKRAGRLLDGREWNEVPG
jgi:protein gp37